MDEHSSNSAKKGTKFGLMAGVALGLYLLYNAIFLIPLHFDITHRLIGATKDPLQWIWFFKWFPYALMHGLNPFISPVIWAPRGLNLTWTTCTPALAILCWPITALWGPFVSYNLVALIAPALGAWMAYLVCREITGRFFPSLLSGWLFGFSSYEIGQLASGHINLFVTWPAPLLLWLAVRWYKGKIKDWQFITAAAAALLLLFGISVEVFTTTIFSAILVAVIAFGVLRAPSSRDKLLRLATLSAVATVAVAVIASPYLWLMLFGPDHPHGPIWPASKCSIDLANLLVPSRWTWLDGGALEILLGAFSRNIPQQGGYIGLPILILWILFIKDYRCRDTGKLIAGSAAVFMLLSLGPWLIVLNHRLPVPMPWWIFNHLPLIQDALPARLTLYLSLASAVMAAVWLADAPANWRLKLALGTACILFLLPNFSLLRLWRIHSEVPAFFKNKVYTQYLYRNENVLLLPVGWKGRNVFWQAESNFYFRIAGGYLGPPPPRMMQNPVMHACMYGGQTGDIANQIWPFIRHAHIGAVIISASDAGSFQWLLSCLHVHPITIQGLKLYLIQPRAQAHSAHGPRR